MAKDVQKAFDYTLTGELVIAAGGALCTIFSAAAAPVALPIAFVAAMAAIVTDSVDYQRKHPSSKKRL